jgi:hypothetical protein
MRAGSPILLLAATLACTPVDAPVSDTAAEADFACELGVPTEEGWVPWPERLEMELGFQGFVLAQLQLRSAADAPSPVTATMLIEPEGTEAVSGSQPLVEIRGDGDGGLSEPILVFFTSGNISYYTERSARVAVRLSGQGRDCAVEARATLANDDPCVHTGDQPLCPGDSGYPGNGGDTGQTGDSGDSGQTGDSGDTGQTGGTP